MRTVCLIGILLTSAFAADVRRGLSDADIIAFIETRLRRDPTTSKKKISVSTREGVVILSGQVDSLLAWDRAGELAEWTRGVRSVVNRIGVLTPARSPEKIRQDVRAALRTDQAADVDEIEVAVSNGVLTLKGQVESWPEQQLALHAVRGVEGVRELRNEIEIVPTSRRSDSEIVQEIQSRMKWDIRVQADPITVDSTQGAVTLTGFVRSLPEKHWAVRDAAVRGVHAVDASRLEVRPVEQPLTRQPFVKPPDAEIRQAILDAFRYDPWVKDQGLAVRVRDGAVVLSGKVSHLQSKRAAEQDAWNTVGVWKVENRIGVQRKTNTDAAIKRHVENTLTLERLIEPGDVAVDVQQGVVRLTGTVGSYFERLRAETIAAAHSGVKDIINELEIRGPWASQQTDSGIRDNIENEIFWNPVIDIDRITVAVQDGVATLTGTTASRAARKQATQAAYEGGAKAVVNRIELEKSRA